MLLRGIIIILGLALLPYPAGSAGPSPYKIADGSKVAVPEKGFVITPPKGWEYRTDLPSLSLFAQAQKEKGAKYQRTIQVMVRKQPVTIDESTAKVMEEELTSVFGQSGNGVSEFHIRNHEIVELTNQTKAVLYYTGMKLDGLELMQIHVLASSDTKHYISTFTDLAQHFDKGTDSPVLMTAWEALSSIEVQGPAPKRFEAPITVFGTIGALALLGLLITAIRHLWSSRQYRRLSEDMEGDTGRQSHSAGHESSTPRSLQNSRSPSHFGGSFQGSSEVTKASAHIANFTVEDNDPDEEKWNLGNTKGGGKTG